MKVVAVIAARNKSTRLRGKIFKYIKGKPVLQHVVERVKSTSKIDQIVIATTKKRIDSNVVIFARERGIEYVCGHERDVLSRFILAAEKAQADVIVRITADCPLIDPRTVDRAVEEFLKRDIDYIGNLAKRSFPRGLDVEVFSREILKKVDRLTTDICHREHVTAFIYENPAIFKIGHLIAEGILKRPDIRLCIDTREDMILMRKIYNKFYRDNTIIDIIDVIKFLDSHPEFVEINRKSELEHLERNRRAGIRQEFVRDV